ncbi:hypothetical protein NDU88_001659 [Pleurodeles waltl]|uniref:Nuclease HARBI1 n=1 Tax=Pleurodeles waltl TaxID=8319 RepID=A0AAV7KQS5_PLEWA|nr:hypothetical protein NDU88_001659 [Pleurodeles waltl]
MEVVADDVVHAGVSGDETGREEGDEEEGDTVEAVAVVLVDSLLAVLLHKARPLEDLPTVKGDFYALGHIPNIIGAIDGTHVALVPPRRSEQVYRNRKSCHSMNVQMEDGPDGGVGAAVEPVDSEDKEAEEEDIDNRNTVIQQYFQ